MDINEDEPDDIKKATPVDSAILSGYNDEKNRSKGRKRKYAARNNYLEENDPPPSRRRRCNLYKTRFPPDVIRTNKPCHQKADIICRDNLSRDEYIDVLSRPRKNHESPCKMTRGEKSTLLRPPSQRIKELAKPKMIHVKDLLETWGSRLRPEIIEAMQRSIETDCAMSPEQIGAYYNEKHEDDCVRVRRVKRKKCSVKDKKKKRCDDRYMDPDTICEEYEMAQRFMRHIISHLRNSKFSPDDHYDLTETILSQLGNVLDYRPSGDGDKTFQMMFMLANGIACWVHGLNTLVAEKLAKQKQEMEEDEEESEDENIEEEKQEVEVITDEEVDDEEKKEEGDEGEGEGEKEDEEETEVEENNDDEEIKIEQVDDGEEAPESEDVIVDENLSESEVAEPEDNEETIEGGEEINDSKITDEEKEDESEQESEVEDQSLTVGEEKGDADIPPESIDKDDQEIGEEIGEEIETEETEDDIEEPEEEETIEEMQEEEKEDIAKYTPSILSEEEPSLAIQGLGEGDLFASEIPYVTFGKIMEIAVKFIEKYEEAETTKVRRRLHNVVLKKLTNLVEAEVPDALDNKMRAVLEILAENIAVFLEEILPQSTADEVRAMAPEIESKEVRDWGHWLESVMDTATNWGKWIHDKVEEAEEKARAKVTRGDWQDWTGTVNAEALQWRMFNLDTKHRMHHADLNIAYKKVVHRGNTETRKSRSDGLATYAENNETEIEAHDLYDDTLNPDGTDEGEAVDFNEIDN